jgi:molybdopterin/thiamine biosynthesis adenylyltransferase
LCNNIVIEKIEHSSAQLLSPASVNFPYIMTSATSANLFSRQIGVIGVATQRSLESICVNVFIRKVNPVIQEFVKCCALMGIRRLHFISATGTTCDPEWLAHIAPAAIITVSGEAASDPAYRNCFFDGNWDTVSIDTRPVIWAKLSNDFQAAIGSDFGHHWVTDASGETPAESFYKASPVLGKPDHYAMTIQDADLFKDIGHVIISNSKWMLRRLSDGQYEAIGVGVIPLSGRIKEAPRAHLMRDAEPIVTFAEPWTHECAPFHGLFCVLAGIASHEVLKLTGKYIPAHEPIRIDFSRFGHILGKDPATWDMRALIAGAGAIGCELLKNVAILGRGDYIVRDMDRVSESNLSRQVLFTGKSIGKWKATEACDECRRYVSAPGNFRTQPVVLPLNRETETMAGGENNRQVSSVAVLLNALDNLAARQYMDQKSRAYSKPLIDSGTLGTKGHVQTCVPGRTAAWCDVRDPPIRETPVCTITSFPNSFKHCIEWAIAKYPELAAEHGNPVGMWRRHFLEPIEEVLSNHPASDGEFWQYGRLVPSAPGWFELDEATRGTVTRLSQCDYPPFDKDDDDSFGTVWDIARLRAKLYGIPVMSREEAHSMTGLIVPAMITTTTVIAGLQFMEYLMICSGATVHMDWNVNLATNEILAWESAAPRIYTEEEQAIELGYEATIPRVAGMGATAWDMYRRGGAMTAVGESVARDIGVLVEDIEVILDSGGRVVRPDNVPTPEALTHGIELMPTVTGRLAPTLVYINL